MPGTRQLIRDDKEFPINGADNLMIETCAFVFTGEVYFP